MNIPRSVPLQLFRLENSGLTLTEMIGAVDQALQLFGIYAHLELKKKMLAVDPVQALLLLRNRLQSATSFDEQAYHKEMITIFNSVRDLHTNYLLPEPYASSVAYLPFMLKEYYDEQQRVHYVVARVRREADKPPFGTGVEVTHWNGMPMPIAVSLNSDDHAGANDLARHIRGVLTLTTRPMLTDLPPREDWVTLTYQHAGGTAEITFPWNVAQPQPPANKIPTAGPAASASGAGTAVGLDVNLQVANRARQVLFVPESMDRERTRPELTAQAAAPGASPVSTDVHANATAYPDELEFSVRETKSGTFGYLGIRSFDVEDFDPFRDEVVRILSLLPQNGLIIDVRGNPGGLILAGENLLQLFTDRRIEPEPVGFRNTPGTQNVARKDFLKQWLGSIEASVETGEMYSQYFPLSDPVSCNAVGRKYPGKSVLLIDAACYSTTDFFTAGYSDHQIGPILGTSTPLAKAKTGAGGANVLSLDQMVQMFPPAGGEPPQFTPLPRGMGMRIAFRRSMRVGANAGIPVEGLGVKADFTHLTTLRDVTSKDADLFDFAGQLLTGGGVPV